MILMRLLGEDGQLEMNFFFYKALKGKGYINEDLVLGIGQEHKNTWLYLEQITLKMK